MSTLRTAFRSWSFRATCLLWTALALWAVTDAHEFRYFFSWDALGYYAYLPATFLHGDPAVQDLAWLDAMRQQYDLSSTLYQVSDLPEGHRLVKYPIGLAVTWTPWFLLGHVAALLTGHAADGFSAPYQWAVRCGVLVYLLIGLLALRRVLLFRFSERVAFLTLSLLLLGTNLLAHVINGLGMVHITNFVLYAGILLYTVRWVERGAWKDALVLAVLMGLQTLTRASELLCVLLPLLWLLADGRWRERPIHYLRQGIAIAGVMFLIGAPQFLLWHHVTGHWLVDTYNNAGEGFDLLAPHTLDFLFSYRKGWFLYTPLMLLTVVALFFLLRRRWWEAFPPIAVFTVVSLYLISSWTCWWYASSYGQRAVVGLYAVLAIPLAVLVEKALLDRRWKGRLLALLLIGCTLLNLFQYWQYTARILDKSRMTKAAYWAVFGRTAPVPDLDDKLLLDRSAAAERGRADSTRYLRMELPTALAAMPWGDQLQRIERADSTTVQAVALGTDRPYTPAWGVPFGALTAHDHVWVEMQWPVMAPEGTPQASFVVTMQHGDADYGYSAVDIDPQVLVPGRWTTITTWYLTPDIRDPRDQVRAYCWHRGGGTIFVAPPRIIIHQPIVLP